MAGVSFHAVSKSFGDVRVIEDIDINIDDGEFVVFVGPSGCGKTTLLRMLAGLEEVTSGTVTIGTEMVNGLPPRDRDIAMVFQTYALYPHMVVEDNIAFPLRMQGQSRAERSGPAREVAEMLGLTDYLHRYPRELSGGQRQRVAMGRAIVRNPAVFLFDEPLSNLDAKLRVQMRFEVKQLHQRLGTTMIFVTHDQVEAMTMADTIVVLRAGRVEQIGSPRDIYDHPNNLFVGEFIGSPPMNVIRGQLRDENGLTVHTDGRARIVVPNAGPGVQCAGSAVLGIRPEHLAIVAPDTADALVGEVVMVETTGSETAVSVRVHDAVLIASTRDAPDIREGQRIGLKPMTERLHLFAGENGEQGRIN